jgi:CBS domain-containing protein
MRVKDIMTKNVAFVNPAATVFDAAKMMQQQNVGSIPVCDQNGLVGIVTDRDIVLRNVAQGSNPQSTIVSDIMTTGITSASPDMNVDDVSQIMAKYQIRRIPVVDNNKLVGIVALGDMAVEHKFNYEASEALTEISKPVK